jgi:hypothetical protein
MFSTNRIVEMFRKKQIILFIACISCIAVFFLWYISTYCEVEAFTHRYNLAFYTCFYGELNNPAYKIPELPSETYDCYYFSNNKDLLKLLDGTRWIQIFDNKEVTDNPLVSTMQSKQVKVCPEDFDVLRKYDYLCYLDSKLDKVSESFIEDMIQRYFINNNYALLLRNHVFLDGSIWNEYSESMKQERYAQEKEKYTLYINQQLQTGLRDTTEEHAQCGLLIRNMKHRNMTKINRTWYSHIQQCGIQDQISFFFVKQLFANDIRMFKEIPFANS